MRRGAGGGGLISAHKEEAVKKRKTIRCRKEQGFAVFVKDDFLRRLFDGFSAFLLRLF